MPDSKLTSWCDRTTVFSFYALIYFLPISTALVEICSTVILTAFFWKRSVNFAAALKRHAVTSGPLSWRRGWHLFTESFQPPAHPLRGPIGIFILINFLSVVVSLYPSLSIKGFIGKLMQSTFLYFSFVETMNTRRKFCIFIGVFFVSTTLIVCNGLAQFFQGTEFIFGKTLPGDGRVASSFKHPNDLGAYLVMVLPMIFSFVMARWPFWPQGSGRKKTVLGWKIAARIFIVVLLAMSLSVLGLTYSRGAWLSFAIGIVFLMGMNRRHAVVPLAAGILFFFIFPPHLAPRRNVSFVSDDLLREKLDRVEQGDQYAKENRTPPFARRMEIWSSSLRRFTAMGRDNYWREAVHIIRSSPLLGTGLNTYSRVGPEYKINWGGYPHNCFLQMAAETGLLGLGSFLWVFLILFYGALKSLKTIEPDFARVVIQGGLAGLLGFIVHSFVDTHFYSVQLGNLMWLMMALVTAVQQPMGAMKRVGKEDPGA